MAEKTKISWCGENGKTFSPWLGCSEVSTGCSRCYAKAMSGRLGVTWGPNGTRRRTAESTWKQVERWNRKAAAIQREYKSGRWAEPPARPRVFPSLCDPFEDWGGPIFDGHGDTLYVCTAGQYEGNIGDFPSGRLATMGDVRRDFFALIDRTPNLDWLLLTKRPENVRRMWPVATTYIPNIPPQGQDYRSNAWLLYSASDQASLEAGLLDLMACRDLVPVLGLSLEPLVGPVDLNGLVRPSRDGKPLWPCSEAAFFGLDWVIVGGESGPRARTCHIDWIRSIRDQCAEAGVPCYIKQLGSKAVGRITSASTEDTALNAAGYFTDTKGGDPEEWPEGLRVRQFPKY